LKGVLCSVCILGTDHLDEAEATALAGVWVTHDVALLDSAVLLEEDSDLFLGQARVDTSDEEVGALVDIAGLAAAGCLTLTAVAVAAAVLARRRNVTVRLSERVELTWTRVYIPLAAATVRVVANTGVAIAVSARRARAGAVTAARVLCLNVSSCLPGRAAHLG
jgi:hypothetical protein